MDQMHTVCSQTIGSPRLKQEMDSAKWCLIAQPVTFTSQLMKLLGFNDLQYHYSVKLD